MYRYHFREWLSFFYFYCIFGWCFESAYVSLKECRLVNRGFLMGPWLPLYGSGAILVLWLTLPFQKVPVLVYLVGALGATALEYATGEAMARLFKVRYWDYSSQRFQYKGHICLSSSIAWGFLSLLMVYVVHRPVEDFIFWMHEEVVSVLTFGITVCIVHDFSNAFRDAMDLRKLLLQAEQIGEELERRMDRKRRLLEAAAAFAYAAVEEKLEEKLEEARKLEERREQLKERMLSHAGRLLPHNPGLRFVTKAVDMEEMRERLRNRNKK